jgi:hypothetical protein
MSSFVASQTGYQDLVTAGGGQEGQGVREVGQGKVLPAMQRMYGFDCDKPVAVEHSHLTGV